MCYHSIQKFATHIQCFDIENLSNGTHVYGRQPSFYIPSTGRDIILIKESVYTFSPENGCSHLGKFKGIDLS